MINNYYSNPFGVSNYQLNTSQTRNYHNSCHCTIVPPHMSDRIKEVYDEEVMKENVDRVNANQQILRDRRAQLFSGQLHQKELNDNSDEIVKIYDAKGGTNLPGKLVKSPHTSKDLDTLEAFEWSVKVHEFYQNIFHRNSIDNDEMPIVSTVHYDKGYNNAFWQGNQMVYGDGDDVYFSRFTIDSDIAAHEMTHGVTQFDMDLEYQDQAGALNESLSDAFGSMAKQYIQNENVQQADWLIGSQLMIGDEYSLRSMKKPGTAYNNHPVFGDDPQPATMDAYNPTKEDYGGVHINSGIPNYAFYLATTKLYEIDPIKYAYSWESTGPVWYEARTLLSPVATFDDFVQATVSVAEKHFGYETLESKAIKYAWADVKLLNYGNNEGKNQQTTKCFDKCTLL